MAEVQPDLFRLTLVRNVGKDGSVVEVEHTRRDALIDEHVQWRRAHPGLLLAGLERALAVHGNQAAQQHVLRCEREVGTSLLRNDLRQVVHRALALVLLPSAVFAFAVKVLGIEVQVHRFHCLTRSHARSGT